jgi:hypothetical protein
MSIVSRCPVAWSGRRRVEQGPRSGRVITVFSLWDRIFRANVTGYTTMFSPRDGGISSLLSSLIYNLIPPPLMTAFLKSPILNLFIFNSFYYLFSSLFSSCISLHLTSYPTLTPSPTPPLQYSCFARSSINNIPTRSHTLSSNLLLLRSLVLHILSSFLYSYLV